MNPTLRRLRSTLPSAILTTDPTALALRGVDRSGAPALGEPLALVRPTSTNHVSLTLAIAHDERTPVVPQGSLTGLAGGANALEGAILLDLSGMNRIVGIDPLERLATVEPGVILSELSAAAAQHGLFYAPDPASSPIASVGGTIATNAGGFRALKYGVTRDAVRSLEVVLASGAVIRTRAHTLKAVAGLDLTGLFVGSEGTLGVITQATLGLVPALGQARGMSGIFDSVDHALDAATSIFTHGRAPAMLELLDDVALDAIRSWDPALALPARARAWLLAVSDDDASAESELESFHVLMTRHGASQTLRADSADALEALLAVRRALHPAMRTLHGESHNGDIVLPRRRLREAASGIARICADLSVTVSVGGHVGDGNLHPIIAFDPRDDDAVSRASIAHHRILTLAQDLGGTVTGEHGIGVQKLHELDHEMGLDVQELQHTIKRAFDPHGILNPGKKLPPRLAT